MLTIEPAVHFKSDYKQQYLDYVSCRDGGKYMVFVPTLNWLLKIRVLYGFLGHFSWLISSLFISISSFFWFSLAFVGFVAYSFVLFCISAISIEDLLYFLISSFQMPVLQSGKGTFDLSGHGKGITNMQYFC